MMIHSRFQNDKVREMFLTEVLQLLLELKDQISLFYDIQAVQVHDLLLLKCFNFF